MKRWKQCLKYGAVVGAMAVMPAWAMAAGDSIDPAPLVAGITSAKAVIVAIAAAIFALVGLLVAIRYGKRAAS